MRQLRRFQLFAEGEGGAGWSERPVVPELAQQRTATPKEERVPWEFGRFVRQSSQFLTLPSLLPSSAAPPPVALRPGDSLGPLPLFPLDDVVMGGASASTFDNARRRWAGVVTTRNSGGFVGVRSKTITPALDLSRATGLALTVRAGGGLRYKVILRDSTDFNGIAHTASFDTRAASKAPWGGGALGGGGGGAAARPQTIRVPFRSFVPTIFARTVPDASLDLRNVVAFQLALSKFEYDGGLSPAFREGPFELELQDIAVY